MGEALPKIDILDRPTGVDPKPPAELESVSYGDYVEEKPDIKTLERSIQNTVERKKLTGEIGQMYKTFIARLKDQVLELRKSTEQMTENEPWEKRIKDSAEVFVGGPLPAKINMAEEILNKDYNDLRNVIDALKNQEAIAGQLAGNCILSAQTTRNSIVSEIDNNIVHVRQKINTLERVMQDKVSGDSDSLIYLEHLTLLRNSVKERSAEIAAKENEILTIFK